MVQFFELETEATTPFEVFVGIGTALQSFGYCPTVYVKLHGNFFHMPFYLFDIHGANMVLGVLWLQSLGPFL